MTHSILALICFAIWTILMAFVMVNHRVFYVLSGRRKINSFPPDGVGVSAFQARAARVHANCYENLPVFASLVLGAAAAGKGAITDSLAMYAIYARVIQSSVHLASTSELAVMVRATFWTVQMLIMLFWGWRLLLG
jgi:uncharacterized MAPEG superfamily protein